MPQDLTQFPPPGAVAIMAFAGWNDAGEAASGVVSHFIESFNAQLVDTINPDDYYDYQIARPRIRIEDNERIIEWSTTKFYLAPATNDRPAFCVGAGYRTKSMAIFLLRDYGKTAGAECSSVISLGTLLADAPHSPPSQLPLFQMTKNWLKF